MVTSHLKSVGARSSLAHMEAFYHVQPLSNMHTLHYRLTCCQLSLGHKPWLSCGANVFHAQHQSLLRTLLLATASCPLPSPARSYHLLLVRFTFSSSLFPIYIFSSPEFALPLVFQPGHTLPPCSDSSPILHSRAPTGLISSATCSSKEPCSPSSHPNTKGSQTNH